MDTSADVCALHIIHDSSWQNITYFRRMLCLPPIWWERKTITNDIISINHCESRHLQSMFEVQLDLYTNRLKYKST